MKKILILLFGIIQFLCYYCQGYYAPIDSIIENIRLGDSDWVIGLTIQQAGRIPMYDSLGNIIDDNPNGTYIISQINKQCILHKYVLSYNGNIPKFEVSKPISIFDNLICTYTKDSIQKTEHDRIYPNIYMDDSLKVYSVQLNGNHSPSFQIYFRTKESLKYSHFAEIDVFIAPRFKMFFHKNLNFDYNSSTFIYRAFINLINLLNKNFRIQILE